MRNRRDDFQSLLLWALLLCLVVMGCRSENPLGRQEISGTVKLDGVPLDRGSIRFEPQGGANLVSAGAVIQNGAFRIASKDGLTAGRYRVSLSAPEPAPVAAPVMGENMQPAADRIPVKYNVQSELFVEVKPGDNVFDFPVVSDRR